MNRALVELATFLWLVAFTATIVHAEAQKPAAVDDKDLATDLKLLQGSWEQTFGNDGTGKPTIRLVKTIEGNTETRREYTIKTGELRSELVADFKLSKSGDVRVFTFHFRGTPPEQNLSYVYVVDQRNFYDVPGLLHTEYHNYRTPPQVYRWRRVIQKAIDQPAEKSKISDDKSK